MNFTLPFCDRHAKSLDRLINVPGIVAVTLNNLEFFKRYEIGLAKFNSEKQLEIVYKPKGKKPYSEAMRQKLVKSITPSRKKSKDIRMLV